MKSKLVPLVMMSCVAVSGVSQLNAQSRYDVLDADPRELSLDIFTSLQRNADPVPIAARLGLLIPAFRYPCQRVTDYQVFRQYGNLYDLKVKCSGSPVYGVTVAANGYGAVYGGNNIIQPLNSRDGLILSFGINGTVIDTSTRSAGEAVEDAVTRLQNAEGDYNTIYLSLMLLGLMVILAGGLFLWFRAFKASTKRVRRMHSSVRSKPKGLQAAAVAAGSTLSSDVKNTLQGEAEIIARHVYKHPAGFYLSRGIKGRRRMFKSSFGARVYARSNWRFGEITPAQLKVLLDKFHEAQAEKLKAPQKNFED